jgi:uncharacterized protein DUF6804
MLVPESVPSMKRLTPFTIARIAVAIMLIVALAPLPYGYYTLLRFLVCGVNGYGTYLSAAELNKPGWAWAFGIIAVLFNPVAPIYLNRGTWAVIDVGIAIFLLASLAFVKDIWKNQDE